MIDPVATSAIATSAIASPVILAFSPGPLEITVILVIALLLFGKRLPEVMRSMGKGIVEFKKGVRGIEDDIDTEASTTSASKTQVSSSGSDQSTGDK